LTHRKQGKAFFFEEKKQKAFVGAVADLAGKVRVSTSGLRGGVGWQTASFLVPLVI
jgi:hypothetical protein